MENIFRDNVAGDWSSGEDEGAGFAEEEEAGLPGMVVQVPHCSAWRGCSVTSDSVFPGKNTGAGCHFLLQGSSQPRD